MLNNGLPSIVKTNPNKPATVPAPVTSPIVQKYADDAPVVTKNYAPGAVATGGVGVQFGAFSNMDSANCMVARLRDTLGANAHIEPNGTGLYRVRVTGLSESAAQSLKNRATGAGIDCYVFH